MALARPCQCQMRLQLQTQKVTWKWQLVMTSVSCLCLCGLHAWYHGTADFVIGGCSCNVEFERYCVDDVDAYVVLCLL